MLGTRTVILGKLYDGDGHLLADAGETSEDGFYNIVLEEEYQGINYAFCETVYPVDAVSKRLFVEEGPDHAPEPSTLVLLAVGGLALSVFLLRGRTSG